MIQNDDRERVRDAADIVRIIGEHLALHPRGREFACICPFHDDHRPSMYVVPDKQIFHCFVCGAGGDVFSFVQKYHQMGFREALTYLAEQNNIELTGPVRSAAGGDRASRSDVIEANSLARDFFRKMLEHTEHGAVARACIEDRGISPDMVREFQIGACPAIWDGLALTVRKVGRPMAHFETAGLCKPRERDDGHYDVFRNRLMFPIQDQIGRVIAFGGRRLSEEDDRKYVNSSDTPAFDKSSTLYGLHQAAQSIRRERQAVVVEGYTDVIACHQAGFTNVVATLGTALTRGHAVALRRLCDVIILVFDGDEAGLRAADRAVDVLLAESIDVRIATLAPQTDAKDPDELLKRENGVETFRAILDQAVDLLPFRFRRLADAVAGNGPAAVERVIQEEIDRLTRLGMKNLSPIRQRQIISELAKVAGVDEEAVKASFKVGRRTNPGAAEVEARPDKTRWIRSAPEEVVACLLCEPDLWTDVPDDQQRLIRPELFDDEALRILATEINALVAAGERPGLLTILDRLEDRVEATEKAVALVETVRRETEQVRLREHFGMCLRQAALDDLRDEKPSDATARMEMLRTASQKLGGNQRVMPRPVVGLRPTGRAGGGGESITRGAEGHESRSAD